MKDNKKENDINRDYAAEIEAQIEQGRAFAKANGLTLERIKINKHFSRETICFTASIVKDGARVVGFAENDGNGGCTFCRITTLPGLDKAMPAGFEWYVDEEISKAERVKDAAAFIKRAHTTAKKRAANLVVVRHENGGAAYALTEAPTLTEWKAQNPNDIKPGESYEFHTYRTIEAQKAVSQENEEKFLAKCRAKSREKNANMAIQRTTAGKLKAVCYTQANTLNGFLSIRPDKAAQPDAVWTFENLKKGESAPRIG